MSGRITVEALESKGLGELQIIDIRKEEDFARGAIEGAVHIPFGQLKAGQFEGLDPQKEICVYCHVGDTSREAAELLEEAGYPAVDLEGGYRSYLRYHLARMTASENWRRECCEKIEKSLRKRFRKTIWSRFTKALNDYELIQDGDKIAVCISGGKDSMLLAKLFQELYRHGKRNFALEFLCMNPGYNAENWNIIQENAKLLDIPLTVFETDIFDSVAEVEKNPCYLCARMRRGHLYSKAQELGCNKIALGHHFDDVIETTLMGMLYSGKIETMMPKLHSQNFAGMELIRPLYLVKEEEIKAWRDSNGLQFIQCACRFTEHCASCGGERGSKREEMKELVTQFRGMSEFIDKNIFNSVHHVNLDTIIGYKKDGVYHSFLEEYHAESRPFSHDR